MSVASAGMRGGNPRAPYAKSGEQVSIALWPTLIWSAEKEQESHLNLFDAVFPAFFN